MALRVALLEDDVVQPFFRAPLAGDREHLRR